jgi:AcrR family transcriptional regulator
VTRQEEILDAAISIADESGIDAVSMRSVAEQVGVTPMALYPHVGSKAALLDGMLGRLLGQLLPESGTPVASDLAGQPWLERLGAIARGARQLAQRHRWAAALLFTRPAAAPGSMRVVDLIFGALLDAGVPSADVPRMERLVSSFILGHVASEAGGRFGPLTQDVRDQRWAQARDELPGHEKLASTLESPVDWDAEFEADLRDVALMIEAVVRGAGG